MQIVVLIAAERNGFLHADQRHIYGIGEQPLDAFRWRADSLPVDHFLVDSKRAHQQPCHVMA